MTNAADVEQRVLVLAPTGRDAPLICDALAAAKMTGHVCTSVETLCDEFDAGCGAVVIAEEALSPHLRERFHASLSRQAPWSDVPVIVLATALDSRSATARLDVALAELGNVTFLERPVRVASLVTTVRAALRARSRQYLARETLATLARREEEAQQRVEFQEQLVAIVSHDLRNPISAMLLAASGLIRRGDAPPHAIKAMMRVVSSGERATRLIRDLLDFTQERTGNGIEIRRASVNVFQLAAQVLDEVRALHPDRAIALTVEGEGSCDCDGDRVSQIIANLVTNAVTYGDPASPVRVSLRGERDVLVIEVRNQGPHIPAEKLPNIFEPFERGAAEVKAAGSIGLGLFIVGALTRAHGGTATVSSKQGGDTAFEIRLPRVALSAAAS